MAGPSECKLAPFDGASGADVVDYVSSAIEVSVPSGAEASVLTSSNSQFAHDHPNADELFQLRGVSPY